MSSELDAIVQYVAQAQAQRTQAVGAVLAARQAVGAAEDKLAATEAAQAILQDVAQAVQQEAHQQIAGVVSRCLAQVFDNPYEFDIIFDRKRGRTEARLVFRRGGLEVDPLTASGGGVVDVAAFALRLACLVLSRPQVRPLVVLDEPFKFVSAQYRDRVRSMLEQLADDMGVQFLMVTHIPELVCGHVVQVP